MIWKESLFFVHFHPEHWSEKLAVGVRSGEAEACFDRFFCASLLPTWHILVNCYAAAYPAWMGSCVVSCNSLVWLVDGGTEQLWFLLLNGSILQSLRRTKNFPYILFFRKFNFCFSRNVSLCPAYLADSLFETLIAKLNWLGYHSL